MLRIVRLPVLFILVSAALVALAGAAIAASAMRQNYSYQQALDKSFETSAEHESPLPVDMDGRRAIEDAKLPGVVKSVRTREWLMDFGVANLNSGHLDALERVSAPPRWRGLHGGEITMVKLLIQEVDAERALNSYAIARLGDSPSARQIVELANDPRLAQLDKDVRAARRGLDGMAEHLEKLRPRLAMLPWTVESVWGARWASKDSSYDVVRDAAICAAAEMTGAGKVDDECRRWLHYVAPPGGSYCSASSPAIDPTTGLPIDPSLPIAASSADTTVCATATAVPVVAD